MVAGLCLRARLASALVWSLAAIVERVLHLLSVPGAGRAGRELYFAPAASGRDRRGHLEAQGGLQGVHILKKKTLKHLNLNRETILHLQHVAGGLEGNNNKISDSCTDNGSACGPAATSNLGGTCCSTCHP